MRCIIKGLVVAAAGIAMFAMPAVAADDQNSDMREMREMVLKLQDQLQAQQKQIDEQKGVIKQAGLEDEQDRGSSSALSSFLESTDFSGWVAASYFWNFNDPNKRNQFPTTNTTYPNGPYSNFYHQDHNSFQIDEFWLTVDRAATSESPAGFHADVVYGATASDVVGGGANFGGNDIWLATANVSYMTPWGQTITAGKYWTTVGYEVAGAPGNVNITRGFMWNLFQPVSQIGATVSQEFDSGFKYLFGVANGFSEDQPDPNQSKTFVWQLGWGNDSNTILFNGVYDPNLAGSGNQDDYVLDLVYELTPADNVLFWFNGDYRNTAVNGNNPSGIGFALGGRVGFAEKYGLGTRFEYAHFSQDGEPSALDGDLFSETLTFDVKLTDNLTWKIEQKYELAGNNAKQSNFQQNRTAFSNNAIYLGSQIYYEF